MSHIIERFVLHFVSSTFITMGIYFSLKYWVRTNEKVGRFISSRKTHIVVLSAVLCAALLPLREPYDVWAGQTLTKAITDQISWFLGAAVSAFGLIRFLKDKQ